jgi:hypothetical protein
LAASSVVSTVTPDRSASSVSPRRSVVVAAASDVGAASVGDGAPSGGGTKPPPCGSPMSVQAQARAQSNSSGRRRAATVPG